MPRPPKSRSAGRTRHPAASSPPAAASGAPALPPPAPPAPPAPAIGRPTTLTPAVSGAILDAIELGVTGVGAAFAAGVPPSTLRTWLTQGRKDEAARRITVFSTFRAAYTRAKGASERSLVATIRAASVGDAKRPGDWRAAAFLIERRHHQRWARHEKVRAELTGRDGTPLNPIAVIEAERAREREAEAASNAAGDDAGARRRRSRPGVGARRQRARETTCPPDAEARKSASQAGGGSAGGGGSKPPK